MNVHICDEHPSSGVDAEDLRLWATNTLTAEKYPPGTEVSVTLVDDDRMAEWNHDALGKASPTDVISFPVESLAPGQIPPVVAGGPPLLIGDVVIAPDYVRQQARALKVDPDNELALMVVHGILHLLGYDHVAHDDAERMEDRERAILTTLGKSRR